MKSISRELKWFFFGFFFSFLKLIFFNHCWRTGSNWSTLVVRVCYACMVRPSDRHLYSSSYFVHRLFQRYSAKWFWALRASPQGDFHTRNHFCSRFLVLKFDNFCIRIWKTKTKNDYEWQIVDNSNNIYNWIIQPFSSVICRKFSLC